MNDRETQDRVALNTRRNFLAQCSTLALAAAIVPTTVSALPATPRLAAGDPLRLAVFSRQVGTAFRVRHGGALLIMELTEACATCSEHPLAANAPDASHEKFSLCFRARAGQRLDQDTYEFEHSQMGRFLMFIVPLPTRAPGPQYYEAIFNRRTEAPS